VKKTHGTNPSDLKLYGRATILETRELELELSEAVRNSFHQG